MAEKIGVVDRRQLELAQTMGNAYRKAAQHLINEAGRTGGMQEVQDMIVGFVQEKAKGLYVCNAENDLEWREPGNANCHLQVVVMDAEDHRFIPYCDVQTTLFGEQDMEHGPYDFPFRWHPSLHHYGRNLTLPEDGAYDIRVHVNPPTFGRHSRENGCRYTKPVEAVFENADITTGTQTHS